MSNNLTVRAAPKFTRAFDVISFQRRIMTMHLRKEIDSKSLSSLNGSCTVVLKALEQGNSEGDYVVRIKQLENIVHKILGSKKGRKLLKGLDIEL
jgi:hypothetical protein